MGLFCMKGGFLHVGEPEKAAKNLSSLFDSLHGSQVQTTLWRCLAVRTLETQHNDDDWHHPIVTGALAWKRWPLRHSQPCVPAAVSRVFAVP